VSISKKTMNNKPGSVYCRHLSETAVSGRF